MKKHYQAHPFRLPVRFWHYGGPQFAVLTAVALLRVTVAILIFVQMRSAAAALEQTGQVGSASLMILPTAALALVLIRLQERRIAERISQRYVNRLRKQLLRRLMRASLRVVQARPVGAMSARLGGDLALLRRWISMGLSRLLVNGLLVAGLLVTTAWINWRLAAAVTVMLLLITTAVLLLGRALQRSVKLVRSTRIRMNATLVERISQLAGIRAMGQERREIKRVQRLGTRLEKQTVAQGGLLGTLRGIGDASGVLLIVAVLAAYTLSSNGAATSLADVVAMVSMALFLSGPIRELGRVQEYYRGAVVSLEKIEEYLHLPRIIPSTKRSVNTLPASGRVEFKNVVLEPALNGFSAVAEPGARIALLGANGSGKSTLIKLAAGLIKPERGQVRVHGVRATQLSSASRAETIGIVGQEYGLLRGSLGRNIRYRHARTDQEELDQVLEFCQLEKLLGSMRGGLNARVNERASNLSSGERGRITIARALLHSPSLLLLDEPEANLDSAGLDIINTLLESYPGTILMATHANSLARACDQIWPLHGVTPGAQEGTREPANKVAN